MKVTIHLTDGFEEIEALAVVDVLRRAGIDAIMVSMTNSLEVVGSHSIKVICDRFFSQVDYTDVHLMVLPGGMPGAADLNQHEGLDELIKEFVSAQKPIAAICAAPMILGERGLLKNKQAVCFPGFERYLPDSIPSGQLVVWDGPFLTAKGAGVAIDFALAMVEHFKGKAFADELALKMIYSRKETN